jgi:hypothetical protein
MHVLRKRKAIANRNATHAGSARRWGTRRTRCLAAACGRTRGAVVRAAVLRSRSGCAHARRLRSGAGRVARCGAVRMADERSLSSCHALHALAPPDPHPVQAQGRDAQAHQRHERAVRETAHRGEVEIVEPAREGVAGADAGGSVERHQAPVGAREVDVGARGASWRCRAYFQPGTGRCRDPARSGARARA